MSEGGRQRLRPSPPPPDVDLGRVALVGTMAWALALVVCAVLSFLDLVGRQAPVVCVAGLVLGGYGVWWCRRGERRRATDPPDDVTG